MPLWFNIHVSIFCKRRHASNCVTRYTIVFRKMIFLTNCQGRCDMFHAVFQPSRFAMMVEVPSRYFRISPRKGCNNLWSLCPPDSEKSGRKPNFVLCLNFVVWKETLNTQRHPVDSIGEKVKICTSKSGLSHVDRQGPSQELTNSGIEASQLRASNSIQHSDFAII